MIVPGRPNLKRWSLYATEADKRKRTTTTSHVTAAREWELDRATGAVNEVCMGRKASNESAVKERLIHLLLDVGVHNSRAPLARGAEELSR